MTAAKAPSQPQAGTAVPGEIKISYPLLWLAIAVLVVYFPSFSFGFTELDDSIFIRDFQEYNEQISNLFGAFGRGLFNPTQDPYYRPIFSDSMILNYRISGLEIGSYHVVNILLHITTIVLLYKLFIRLKLKQLHAFLLCAVFAVHPVLCQAVAWIPGRNDTILAVFILAFFNKAIDYAEKGNIKNIVLASFFLLLAFFTKETAVFAAPAAFVILVLALGLKPFEKRNLTLYGTWAGCFIIWFAARSMATVHIKTDLSTARQVTDFIHRLPVMIQYMGKIFLPFNLTVFPIQKDTVYYFGFIAVALLAALIYFSENVNWRRLAAGFAVFLLFLLPALLVPGNLNEQTFEHRLYLPVIGILLLLPETALFKRLTDKNLLVAISGICVIFAAVNFNHQYNFSDPFAFWHKAANGSPNSAYANMMLAAREDRNAQELAYEMRSTEERQSWVKNAGENAQLSFDLFHKAYGLNPNEKYLNFYYGCMLQKKDSILASEPYFLKEKKTSGYYECDFYLARVAMTKNDTAGAIGYMETYLKKDAGNPQANNNLLLMYFSRRQFKEAKMQVSKMQVLGLPVPQAMVQQLNAMGIQ